VVGRASVLVGVLGLMLAACQPLPSFGTAATPTLVPTFTLSTQPSAAVPATPTRIPPTATAAATLASTLAGTAPTGPSAAIPTQDEIAGWSSYHDDGGKFSLLYPSDWRRWDSSGYPVIFSVEVPPGTTLGEKQMRINVIQGVAECSNVNAGGPVDTAPPENMTTPSGMTFLKESGADAGAGNVYQLTSYSILHGTTCVTITFVLHSSNPQMYDTPPPDYDPVAESQVFTKILNTLQFDP
jgi:hypothetical protein